MLGETAGRKRALSLFLSEIFIPSAVASKQDWWDSDEVLITQDFNDLKSLLWVERGSQ